MIGKTFSLAVWMILFICCTDFAETRPLGQGTKINSSSETPSTRFETFMGTRTLMISFKVGQSFQERESVKPIHSWYPKECCMQLDCAPIDANLIKRTSTGWYVVESRETLGFKDPRVRPSPDKHFHRCMEEFWEPDSKTRCLFVPKLGMI